VIVGFFGKIALSLFHLEHMLILTAVASKHVVAQGLGNPTAAHAQATLNTRLHLA
jgi:hypothetical protein